MAIDQTHIDKCSSIAHEFGARRLLLFGSALKSPDTAQDIDLACEGVEGWEIFRFGARLEEELGVGVDLVPLRDDDRFSRHISQKARVIYERR